ncbi:MAG: preprotein translocase subunit SecE [Rothia sp. (in: high G+C Gram-positive bacteria)]|uniref:preprotein translocase subunit SecE n=1 Tax=Rothia sp. (in: high G+C Gram-positive bacteria) TaxID=1885016 RepID=UPI0026E0C671|nr:preprotein translocase subunit SecE [Rothia sp. (in: high G+C Gram-positive bacteria)]MDO5749911.1 preprotein translocase subunit SecE [Rothia sp. (in: high G+C Gram-positive bacteria)]
MAKATTVDTGALEAAEGQGSKDLGFFARIMLYLRQVVAELKKVTAPTGKELVAYFVGVLVFVIFMLLLISGLDYVFGQGAFWIFGNGTLEG